MPYESAEDLPENLQRLLPPRARMLYIEGFNKAWYDYGWEESACHRYAWGYVKAEYAKSLKTGRWILKR